MSGDHAPATPASRPSQRRNARRYGPALVLVLVLAAAGGAAWTAVFLDSAGRSSASCNPSAVPGVRTVLPATALDRQAPASPHDSRVTVLNGNGERGQARLTAAELDELGIAPAAAPDTDALYPAGDLTCTGQIRFGPPGAAAARTMSLIVPCAELVDDHRDRPTVDMALGRDFHDVAPTPSVVDVLRSLPPRAAGASVSTEHDLTPVDMQRTAACGR